MCPLRDTVGQSAVLLGWVWVEVSLALRVDVAIDVDCSDGFVAYRAVDHVPLLEGFGHIPKHTVDMHSHVVGTA